MINSNKCYCPSSEDFFYWPPEDMAQYTQWCETSLSKHRNKLKKIIDAKKTGVLRKTNLKLLKRSFPK